MYFEVSPYNMVMDYDEACFMHLTPGVVHNFSKTVGVYHFCPPCTTIQIPIRKEKGATPGILVSCLNNGWYYTTPGLCERTAMLNMK